MSTFFAIPSRTNATRILRDWFDQLKTAGAAVESALGLTGANVNAAAVLNLVSTTKGILIPRMTTGQRDAIATPPTSLLIFNSTTARFEFYNGASWSGLGSGGGGGGALVWVEDSLSPVPDIASGMQVYRYEAGLTQSLFTVIRVPASYSSGSPINLRLTFHSASTSGNALIQSVATLIRPGTDAISSTTNQRTSTNAAVTLSGATANIPQAVTLDLSSASGQINAVNVSAGDLIRVELRRGTDTATGDVVVPVYAAEVTFSV